MNYGTNSDARGSCHPPTWDLQAPARPCGGESRNWAPSPWRAMLNPGPKPLSEAPAPHEVLIVDDDRLLLGLMTAAFDNAGYATISVDNGRKALKAMETYRPALVITDIVMPEMEGIGMILALRRTASPPKVIAISGATSTGSRNYLKWAKQLGADEVLEKPFRMSALLQLADGLVNRHPSFIDNVGG